MTPVDSHYKIDKARQFLLESEFAKALSLYERLIRQRPNDAVIWFEYGNAAAGLRDRKLADRAWRRAIDLAPHNSGLILQVGHQYQGLRMPDLARACFARAAAVDPRGVDPRISLAALLERQHRLDEARAAVAECLAIDAHDDQARYLSAVLDRRENHVERAEQRLRDLIGSDPKHSYVRYACRYELAQLLDLRDEFDEAMKWLAEAKQMVRGLADVEMLVQSYDREAEAARRFASSQPKDVLAKWSKQFPQARRETIPPLAFLGGHPRSGTTLLEQILDAHPGVIALDEPTAFTDVIEPDFQNTANLPIARLNVLRRRYTRALTDEVGVNGSNMVLVDKNPSPTARLPVWLRVFPELRVIVALRDPRDVVLSCYFQNILLNATNVNFLSVERLAKHYADLMDVWLAVREWEGFAWLETRYEDLVTNLEREGRRVTEFLGLLWNENQRRFYENSRTKQLYSPTYQDVTRPVHIRSVGRWRAYEKYLAPILPAIAPYCRRFGYE